MYLLLRLFLNAFGLVLAATIVPAIEFESIGAVIWGAIVAGLVNALIRPFLFVLTLPLTIFTLGLFTLVLNALLLQFVAWTVPGFQVGGFWSAFVGSLILSLVSFIGSRFLSAPEKKS